MRRYRVGGWLVAAAVVGVLASGCATARRQPAEPGADDAAVAVENLDDLSEEGSVIARADLEPEEREAVERAGMARPDGQPAGAAARDGDGVTDTAGKASLSVLTVALTLAAVAAPFFLF